MGTNFYLLDETHLGKQSMSGAYCYDCDVSLVTLQRGGYDAPNPHMVERPYPILSPEYMEWWSNRRCPSCGRGPSQVENSSSFTFAKPPEWIAGLPAETPMENEYGDRMTVGEFRRDLLECKFFFTDAIGRDFS